MKNLGYYNGRFDEIENMSLKSWFDMGAFNLQPVEFVKIFWIVYMAVYYNRVSSKKKMTFMQFFWPLIVAVTLFILIALQPDLGGALIICLISEASVILPKS